ncbi:SDH family Clp fold serine proteinase [Asanoa hainanensis]|nr:hypothetical protein [Asanoa hainanensis]
MIDAIFAANVTYLEELLFDAEVGRPLHLMIASPGGDGEAAVRMVRSIRTRCSQLTVIVPDLAKSAATLICLGADRILMGPAGDLGPVDPQFQIRRSLVSAREIVAAVAEAEARIKAAPDTYPLFAALLSDVNLLMVEQARSAIQRSEGLVREALSCCTGRGEDLIDQLTAALKRPLIDEVSTHNTVVPADAAAKLGLPAEAADVTGDQWHLLWSLWTRYFLLGCFPAGQNAVYEGRRVSHVEEPA